MPPSVTARAPRSSRTRWLRPSSKLSSTSSTVRAFRARVRSSTWVSRPVSCVSPAPGSPTGDDQLGQGKENVRQFLVDNPELANEIEQKILVSLGIGETPDPDQASQDVPDIDPDEDAGF